MTAKTVLCFGDSNTHGTMPMASFGDKGRFPFESRWTSIMAGALGPGWHVLAEGHPGRTTAHDDPLEGAHKNAQRSLLALLESHRPIDLIVIMLGTNDLKSRFQVTPTEITLGVETLVQVVRASGCGPNKTAPDLLVVAPPPLTDSGVLMEFFQGGVEKSQKFAQSFAAMGERAGVAVWDAGSVCSMSQIDGIHLDEEGHRALGLALADQIRQLGH
ncbi:MAG: SGNH/GDSL hydrolase family protein [Rhizobiales bacterium]|nr:SGNH/GDSL hydrolase family protein [Hyphomicrobiales bacterium]MBO6698123.1 SGNH/GDSL hydrolase family protein [Hyphomicrobiales bacterium]MBO6735623.1 SGNH/GDSL hydrolase family protein [Hyphomicrobiales bacterium]MBO6910569.1 SGNH/GDSL hydrolase family protein [Hyphomicrobiales bacterium]MBO6957148.1 SGNH/GDSL hydrolase family protein [Hyphomicrobiales bacterium]